MKKVRINESTRVKFLFLIHRVRTYICSNLRTLGIDIISGKLDLTNVVKVSYLIELSNNNSISVFCGIIKATFI